MKLQEIRIEKFRSIRKCEIRVSDKLALVGQNSVGKSTILRALNVFFNTSQESEALAAGRHKYADRATSIIDLSFGEVPEDCPIPRTQEGGSLIRVRLRHNKSFIWEVRTGGRWQAAPDNLQDLIREQVRYIYVPMRRDHEVSSWGAQGLLKQAVLAWFENHTKKRDFISPRVSGVGDTIQRTVFKGLTRQLREHVPLRGSFDFELSYGQSPNYEMLLNNLVLRVTEGNTTVDLADTGSGTQSMTAFALYSLLAKIEGTTYVLGFEEPEQNLHPQAQRQLIKSLDESGLQVLFTTHSTVIVDELRHDQVVLCRRDSGSPRGIETATSQVTLDFWQKHKLSEDSYYKFHRRRNSEFLFARFVIVTESPIDAAIVSYLIENGGVDIADSAVSVLSIDGVNSLPYAYHLLRDLGIPFVAVLDKDYFMPYRGDSLKASRDGRGFPKYKREFKSGILVDRMLPRPSDRAALLNLLHENHAKAMDLLETAGVYCFNWSLEADLVNGTVAFEKLCAQLRLKPEERTTTTLLEERKDAMKRLENLMPVVSSLEPRNLPNSYKRLRSSLSKKILQESR